MIDWKVKLQRARLKFSRKGWAKFLHLQGQGSKQHKEFAIGHYLPWFVHPGTQEIILMIYYHVKKSLQRNRISNLVLKALNWWIGKRDIHATSTGKGWQTFCMNLQGSKQNKESAIGWFCLDLCIQAHKKSYEIADCDLIISGKEKLTKKSHIQSD